MDWRHPKYAELFTERKNRYANFRAHPEWMRDVKTFYRNHPADFISDWGVTFDPRNADIGRVSLIPFILTPKQREWIDWVMERWKTRTPGLCEKSRDMGVTWLAGALAATLCIFRSGLVIGFGSRKAEYVDDVGVLKPILPKIRMFVRNIPEEFCPGWVQWRDAPQMRVGFPSTGSVITGEAGDQIGRGDRASIYFVDEAAHLPRPQLVEAALSQTTNCRIDMSSVNGMNNPFAQKRWGGKVKVFIFDWRDDPRKDEDWYAKQKQDLDPVTVAQEIDRDYSASVEGILIPGEWVRAAIGARETLGIAPSGHRAMSLDVADEGIDKNAICGVHGIEVERIEEWSGKGSDIFETVQGCFTLCDEEGYDGFRYDADGLGAGVRGDARIINEARQRAGLRVLDVEAFRGSEGVYDPEGLVYPDARNQDKQGARRNIDFFKNRKAQAGWNLRGRFQRTYRWRVEGVPCDPDSIISLNPKMPLLLKLCSELSQPTFSIDQTGKIIVDKTPPGMKSPNLYDAVAIRYASVTKARLKITQETVAAFRTALANRPRLRGMRPRHHV